MFSVENNRFCCNENLAYFLEQKEGIKEEIDKEYENKNKSHINSYNSEETKEKYGIYVFYIDYHPELKFPHAVGYVWLNIKTKQYEIIDASCRQILYQPGIDITPFEIEALCGVGGVDFWFGKGGGIEYEESIDHKENTKSLLQSQSNDTKKIALVFDGGDTNKSWLGNAAYDMAKDADKSGDYLKNNGFYVKRVSQYWDNGHTAIPVDPKNFNLHSEALEKIIRFFDKEFQCPDGKKCNHEFFLYITAHGATDETGKIISAFTIFDPTGSGKKVIISYFTLASFLKKLPGHVEIIVFIDSCYSGIALDDLYSNLCRGRDSKVIVMTASDATKTAYVGNGFDSATDDFLEASEEEYDGDDNKGDFYDRWRHMEDDGWDCCRPQLFLWIDKTRYLLQKGKFLEWDSQKKEYATTSNQKEKSFHLCSLD